MPQIKPQRNLKATIKKWKSRSTYKTRERKSSDLKTTRTTMTYASGRAGGARRLRAGRWGMTEEGRRGSEASKWSGRRWEQRGARLSPTLCHRCFGIQGQARVVLSCTNKRNAWKVKEPRRRRPRARSTALISQRYLTASIKLFNYQAGELLLPGSACRPDPS